MKKILALALIAGMFMPLMTGAQEKKGNKSPEERFKLLDTNSDGKLSKEDFKVMEPSFTTMEDNVSHLIEPQEKERWVANHAMWQIAMNMSGLAPDAAVLDVNLGGQLVHPVADREAFRPLVGAVAAVLMVTLKIDPIIAVALTLIAGGLIGVFQGYWVAYLKVPSFIVTLAGMLLFRQLDLGSSYAPSILPGLVPAIGSTEAEARALEAELEELIIPEYGLAQLAKRVEHEGAAWLAKRKHFEDAWRTLLNPEARRRGVIDAMNYAASTALAFDSVEHIMRDVNWGWLMRYGHANGASAFFVVIYVHIFRGFFYSSYKAPREMVWLLGVVIFLLMMATAFMGYVLPWGQMSFWGAKVIDRKSVV